MVYCNLAVLLAERHMKISNLSAETGISRTTLTALCQNSGKGVQTDTINTLCMYLNINVGDLFSFYPFDLSLVDCNYHSVDSSVDLVFNYASTHYGGEIHCGAQIDVSSYTLPERGCYAVITLREYEPQNQQDTRNNGDIAKAFKAMPISVVDALKEKIADMTIRAMTYESNVEIDGEIYGYPEALDAWDISVKLPVEWEK